jgi:phosphoribosylaminoimidazolecarboxamide formyltransferase/IMP cyclohydrolase
MTTNVTADTQLAPTEPGEVQVSRALLSVSDKAGIVDFARGLVELGIEIVSTGGTAQTLAAAGVSVRSITDLTGFSEVMDGRVKTLHPKLYMSLLALRNNPEHIAAARAHEVEPVDLVCVNLYPFEQTVARAGVSEAEVIENIDIGGPTMIRAAAKNYAFAAPVVSPASYDAVLDELRVSDRRLSLRTRESLAAEAFSYTARYDTAITRWFQEKHEDFPQLMVRAYELEMELPYGENPHQRAAFYSQVGAHRHVLSQIAQLGGKQLSFNNLLDLDGARNLLAEFEDETACVIIKHSNPCAAAVDDSAAEAYKRAFACDPQSAFGGVIALNGRVDKATAEAIMGQFVEVLLARGYDDDALEVLAQKPKLRLLDDQERRDAPTDTQAARYVTGGALVQDVDLGIEDRSQMTVASKRQPTEQEWADMLFGWKVCKHVKSNAIVFAANGATLGVGAGQMSRVDSAQIAIEKAQSSLAGSAVASDAFFPFPDTVEISLKAGATAFIQPGGSIRDGLSIDAVDAAGATMVFTGHRHFRH